MEQVCFGVDIGGTSVKVGLFGTEGRLIEKWDFSTRRTDNGKDIIEDSANFILEKMKEHGLEKKDVVGVGVDIPGPVKDNGEVLEIVNIGLGHFNIEEEMNRLTGLRIKAGNDANVAALGEQWQGSGKDFNNLVLVTLGTGVGGGIIYNGSIIAGSNGAAGEIGHMLVNRDETEACNCGKKGCMEQYASATGIVRLAKLALKNSEEASALRQADKITAKAVFDCAKEGDALSMRVVDEACYYLGVALSNVAQVFDPEAFIIGGGVSGAGEILIEKIKENYNNNVMESLKNKEFKLAILGNDAGIYGCAKMILASNR